VFIGGLGRSGSTLLERLLGQGEDLQALGETVHLWTRGIVNDERCGCGQPFSSCEFWSEVGATAFGGWSEVDVERVESLRHDVDRLRRVPMLLAGRGSGLRAYTDYYAQLYAAAHATGQAEWLVDSSKHPSLAHCLRTRPDIDLRVVHVVRDPRAVAYSWTRVVARPEATSDTSDRAFMTTYSPARTAMLWNAENLAIEALRMRRVPVHRVRYEDFVAQPAATLDDVLDFIALTPDRDHPTVTDGVAFLEATHTASGNPMRFTTGPVEIRRDDAWRTGLPARDRRLVGALTWPLARRYGYLNGPTS
jgi:Sulfotransferase family